MADIFERAAQLLDGLIKFMKSREVNDPFFTQTMQMVARLKNAKNETAQLLTRLNENRDDEPLKKSFEASHQKLEKIVEECEKYLSPSGSSKPAAAAVENKKILIPKELTFVSLDVQGSEDLKQGEEAANVSKAFSNYYALVEKIFKENAVKKFSWAGDGFIAYFDKAENAVLAIINLKSAMQVFNITKNPLSKNFRVRMGVSTGEDYFDEAIEIGKMASKVIDLAGYLQKKADIVSGPKAMTRILLNAQTLMKVHGIFSYQRSLKIEKVIIQADESKKMQAFDAYELVN